jgi:hypothetical protein
MIEGVNYSLRTFVVLKRQRDFMKDKLSRTTLNGFCEVKLAHIQSAIQVKQRRRPDSLQG